MIVAKKSLLVLPVLAGLAFVGCDSAPPAPTEAGPKPEASAAPTSKSPAAVKSVKQLATGGGAAPAPAPEPAK